MREKILKIPVFISVIFLFNGCTDPKEVGIPPHHIDDAKRNCHELRQEMEEIAQDVHNLLKREHLQDHSKQAARSDDFVKHPHLFMDVNEIPELKQDASRARYQRLRQLSKSKNCAQSTKP